MSAPNVLVSVDPGIRVTACAVFEGGMLRHCACVKNPAKKGSGPREAAQMGSAAAAWISRVIGLKHIDTLVLEVPQIYQRGGGRTKGNPNGLTPLFGVDTAIATVFPEATVLGPYPRDWKGTVSGDAEDDEGDNAIIRQRLESRLGEIEMQVFRAAFEALPKSIAHNLVDAAAIGMHALGRFDKKRVFHRI